MYTEFKEANQFCGTSFVHLFWEYSWRFDNSEHRKKSIWFVKLVRFSFSQIFVYLLFTIFKDSKLIRVWHLWTHTGIIWKLANEKSFLKYIFLILYLKPSCHVFKQSFGMLPSIVTVNKCQSWAMARSWNLKKIAHSFIFVTSVKTTSLSIVISILVPFCDQPASKRIWLLHGQNSSMLSRKKNAFECRYNSFLRD